MAITPAVRLHDELRSLLLSLSQIMCCVAVQSGSRSTARHAERSEERAEGAPALWVLSGVRYLRYAMNRILPSEAESFCRTLLA